MWKRYHKARVRKSDKHHVHRHYTTEQGPWPRLSIRLWAGYQQKSRFRVSVEEKRKPGAWWHEAYEGLPVELIPELKEMLDEAAKLFDVK